MTATPLRAVALGATLALVTSLASAQQTTAPPPVTVQAPNNTMMMQPGAQPMANPQVASQRETLQRSCRQRWQQMVAAGQKNGETRDQFLANCMQGH
jgi:hypothetical protein